MFVLYHTSVQCMKNININRYLHDKRFGASLRFYITAKPGETVSGCFFKIEKHIV